MMTNAIVGGVLIGVAVTVMLLFLGRITGISGIFNQAFLEKGFLLNTQNVWRWFFFIGMLLGAYLVHEFAGIAVPEVESGPTVLIIVSGLLVGFGVNFGSGCTSGHGICGISRYSLRSMVATMVFMAVAMITVFISHHI